MKHLKLLFAFCLILCLSQHAVADICHYVKETEDPFSKQKLLTATMACGQNCSMLLERNGDKYFIGFELLSFGLVDEMFTKGKSVMLKLENGEVLEIASDNDVAPIKNGSAGGTWTTWTIKTEVDKATYMKLSKSPISVAKFTLGGKDNINSLKDRPKQKIMETAECIVTHK